MGEGHLEVLEAAGLVASTRVGREVRYTVRPAMLDVTARWMNELATFWDERLAVIKRVAEGADRAGTSDVNAAAVANPARVTGSPRLTP